MQYFIIILIFFIYVHTSCGTDFLIILCCVFASMVFYYEILRI